MSDLKAVLFDLFGWPSREGPGRVDANHDLVWGDIDNPAWDRATTTVTIPTDLCDCGDEPRRGLTARKHMTTCRYGIIEEWESYRPATVERFGDAVMAALRLRLVHGATDATYTPREVAEMVLNVMVKQLAALREGETP